MNDRNYRAVIAGVGIMWITMLASLYYHTARLEAQIRVWEDSVVQQLDALKHDIRLSSERREGRYASVLHDVRGALAHRSPVARQARLTAAGQVGASVARLERSLSLQGASTEAKLDALKAERAMDARVRSLQDLAAQRLREVEQVRACRCPRSAATLAGALAPDAPSCGRRQSNSRSSAHARVRRFPVCSPGPPPSPPSACAPSTRTPTRPARSAAWDPTSTRADHHHTRSVSFPRSTSTPLERSPCRASGPSRHS